MKEQEKTETKNKEEVPTEPQVSESKSDKNNPVTFKEIRAFIKRELRKNRALVIALIVLLLGVLLTTTSLFSYPLRLTANLYIESRLFPCLKNKWANRL